jgi:hypothetical protein
MKRREFLTLLAAVLGGPSMTRGQAVEEPHRIDLWHQAHDRVFLGRGFWANPMEDWRVQDGWAACQTAGGGRTIHSLLEQLTDPGHAFTMSVELDRPEAIPNDGGAGFRIGITSDIDDYRANCFSNTGINAGIRGRDLMLGGQTQELPGAAPGHVVLMLIGRPAGDQVELTLSAVDPATQEVRGSVTNAFAADQLVGNIALASQFAGPKGRPNTPGYRFRDWQLSGEAFSCFNDRAFGPILWSMYTLSDSRGDDGFVMKLTALLGPMGEDDNTMVQLEVLRGGTWVQIDEAELDSDARTATFRIANWDASEAVPFRLVYLELARAGIAHPAEWTGTIRANPVDRPLRIGALTCQNAVGFPYQPVADNLSRLDLDMLYFSGDQLYEDHGGFGVIRNEAEPAILNYLRKFFMFGWSFREPMRHAPTICLPDDHDVFQGNIWGEGGAPMDGNNTSSSGGYIQPARMVNVVHKTNCSHHPDFASPRTTAGTTATSSPTSIRAAGHRLRATAQSHCSDPRCRCTSAATSTWRASCSTASTSSATGAGLSAPPRFP